MKAKCNTMLHDIKLKGNLLFYILIIQFLPDQLLRVRPQPGGLLLIPRSGEQSAGITGRFLLNGC